MKLVSLASSLFLAASVSAHATFQEFWVGATDDVGTCVRLPLNNNPVTSVTTTDIACNTTPGASPGLCTVAAGGQVSVGMSFVGLRCADDLITPALPEMHQQVRYPISLEACV